MATARLLIKDEVNVKIDGLDLRERKELSNKFKYEIPGARYLPAVRLGRWDGKISFFQLGGSTYVNLLSDIIPVLEEYNYDIDLEGVDEDDITQDVVDFLCDNTWAEPTSLGSIVYQQF